MRGSFHVVIISWQRNNLAGKKNVIGLEGQDGSISARYSYDEFGAAENPEKFDLNWPGPDNLFDIHQPEL